MTLKTNITFDESPVLRSLEQVAIKKGLVTPEPMVKEASIEESYAPGDDLHEDMLKLVAGLRAKGFEKEAEALEDKINARKFAEQQAKKDDGEKLLDQAHPEGDVEVSPSASGLGKVWTEQSAKKEILKVVKKQPTGKHSASNVEMEKIALTLTHAAIAQDLRAFLNEQLIDQSDIHEALWWGDDPAVSDEDAHLEIAQKHLAPSIIKFLKVKRAEGYNPQALYDLIKSRMLEEKLDPEWYSVTAIGGNILDVGKLWSALASGKRDLISLFKAEEAEKGVTGAIKRSEVTIVATALNNVVRYLGTKTAKTPEQQKAIDTLREDFDKWRKALNRLPAPTNWEKVVSVLPDFANMPHWSAFKFWAVNKAMKWAEQNIAQAHTNYDLTKEGQPTGERYTGKPTDPTKVTTTPTGRGPARGVVTQIQSELDELADALDSVGAKKSNTDQLRHTGSPPNTAAPDGRWGPATREALEHAEGGRQHHVKKYKPSTPLPEIKVRPDASTLNALKMYKRDVLRIKGRGAGYRQRGAVEYDKNLIKGKSLTNRDLMSLHSYLMWLVRAGAVELDYTDMGETVQTKTFGGWVQMLKRNSLYYSNKASQFEEAASPEVYEAYRTDAMRLWGDLRKLLLNLAKRHGATASTWIDQNLPIPVDDIRGMGGISMGRGRPGEDGYGQGEEGEGEGRGRGDVILEMPSGRRVRLAPDSVPPVSRHIDLHDRRYWGNMGLKRTLDFEKVANMSGQQFADTYFKAGMDPSRTLNLDRLAQAASLAGWNREHIQRQQNGVMVMVMTGGGGPDPRRPGMPAPRGHAWVDARSLPQIQQAYARLNVVDRYTVAAYFLRALRGAMTPANSKYSDKYLSKSYELRKEMEPFMDGRASEWTDVINRLLSEMPETPRA